MAARISRLALREPAVVDRDAIELLKRNLGAGQGLAVIERAAFDLSERLGQLEAALYAGELERVARIARFVTRAAGELGLVRMATVAGDLVRVIEAQDFVATAAVCRRLLRVGEASLYHAVDLASENA